ncbi:MAG: SRPBCC family protein, partial [Planctomycetota bacterium]
MGRTTVSRTIEAPIETVFDTVAHIENFSKAIPDIVNVEFLSDVRSGVGTHFRETRRMRGKEVSVELAVTEYVENDHIRIVSDTHGTVWDTVFTVEPATGGGI